MATAYTANERAAIEDVIQLYIEGVSTGDTDKLQEAFHGDAWMFGSLGGTRYDVPISQLIDVAVSHPFDSDGSYQARISSIQQAGDAATAIVEEDGCWGGVSFVDFFALAKIDDSWKIAHGCPRQFFVAQRADRFAVGRVAVADVGRVAGAVHRQPEESPWHGEYVPRWIDVHCVRLRLFAV